ncbi:MAG: diacylglycerol kinase family protein [Novosphingobium sp.]
MTAIAKRPPTAVQKGAMPVVVNASGGTAKALGINLERDLREAFAAAGLPINLYLVPGDRVVETIGRLDASLIAIGGGDGTLGGAAGVLHAQGKTLAILPLGTRNHLAKQLGIPADLPGAARVIAAGATTRIDLGCAGDRIFVNNLSIGIYTRLVRAREAIGGPKWLATVPAAWHALKKIRSQHLSLTFDGETRSIKSPLLFIGNNQYSIERSSLGQRHSLSEGLLSLMAVDALSASALVWFGIRAAIGLLDKESDFGELANTAEVTIESRHSQDVAIDGELEKMQFPLACRVLPSALKVIVPAES